MRNFFNRNWAGEYRGSLSWTKTAGRLNWRMPDRLGYGRIAALSICGSDRGTSLQKQGKKWGSAWASPMAAPMPKSISF